jgi:hypothetical protein
VPWDFEVPDLPRRESLSGNICVVKFPRNGVENSPKMAYPKIRKSETKKIRRKGMNRDGKWNRV